MTTLSVIIPVYSAVNAPDRCVESLVNQTYTNLQIILVNCGGADCAALCGSLAAKDSRICVVNSSYCCNAAAKNAGLDAASGDYIVFAQADSVFGAESISECIKEITTHKPDLLVGAVEAAADDARAKYYIDNNMYTRSEYTETIARYISTGVGFRTVENKVFSAFIIKSRGLRFSEDMPLVADELFNCRYFTAAGHIRCISHLISKRSDNTPAPQKGTTDYLRQGKAYSQALIDAVQSKGLYGAASQAIGENYQQMLYRHLVYLSLPDENLSLSQRAAALEELSATSDYAPLMLYLSAQRGIKNTCIYNMFKLRQWKLLLTALGK